MGARAAYRVPASSAPQAGIFRRSREFASNQQVIASQAADCGWRTGHYLARHVRAAAAWTR